ALEFLDTGWTLEEVGEIFNVLEKSIQCWEDKLIQKGEVSPTSVLRGRPRLLNVAVMAELRALIQESPSLFLDEISDYVSLMHEKCISITALHNNLCHLGLTYKMMQRTASQWDEQARQAWRKDIVSNFTKDQFLFIDESGKDGRTLYWRYVAVRIVKGAVDGAEFYDFIVNEVLVKMNPYPQPRSILVMDNCSMHKSEALRGAVEASGKSVSI
ncbi:hypothetical protein BDN67DRAFT_917373, partial [Paxillus ammoniavirescens]